MKQVIAYADEFGNNSFEFETQSTHFIIASVIINLDELDEVKNQLEEVRIKYFQKGEIKSNKVSDNITRRIKILEELNRINFSIYAVIIDKQKLYGEGFKYKKSFYKFLNGILYKELFRTFPELELIVDEHGGNDFMKGFKKYVEANHIRNLFSGSEFQIKKSHNDLGVQLADFIAGTLGFIFDEHKKSDQSPVLYNLIKKRLTSINNFPKDYEVKKLEEGKINNQYDETITILSLNRIYDFIDKSVGNNIDKRDRINFLKLLLLYHESNHQNKYTNAKEFINHLNINREKPLTEENFRNKIVGALRDEGILIASSRDGYKVPTSLRDIKRFVNLGKNIILPMLKRIQECRKAILLATTNELDILEETEFLKLKRLL